MEKKLSELKRGEKGIITSNKAQAGIRRRLMDMGLIRGAEITVIRKAPLGDPIEICLNGFFLTLRIEEADKLIIKTDS